MTWAELGPREGIGFEPATFIFGGFKVRQNTVQQRPDQAIPHGSQSTGGLYFAPMCAHWWSTRCQSRTRRLAF